MIIVLTHICVTWPQWVISLDLFFTPFCKFEHLFNHIVQVVKWMNYLSKYGTRCEVIKLLLKKYDWLHVTWLFFRDFSHFRGQASIPLPSRHRNGKFVWLTALIVTEDVEASCLQRLHWRLTARAVMVTTFPFQGFLCITTLLGPLNGIE